MPTDPTTAAATTFKDRISLAHEALTGGHALNGANDRVRALRRDAIGHVRRLGLPTRRSEAWKYTPIEKALARGYRLALELPGDATAADVDAALIPGLDAHVAVLVNGRFRADLSRIGALPDGAIVGGLGAAAEAHRAIVDAHLGAYARPETEVFTALNTAFLVDGVFVYVPAGADLETPVHIVHLVDAREAVLVQPRVLVVTERGAHAVVVETMRVAGDGLVFANPVTEVSVGENARVEHYRVQDGGERVTEVTTTDGYGRRDSVFSTTTVTLSGDMVRNNVRVLPDGENGLSNLRGLFLAEGALHIDNSTFVDHAKPHCESHELYKGILDGRSRGVFNGRILVRPDAQKTNAYQSSRAIVLSDGAQMNSKPELEIYADDVKCSHGAATGRLDTDALFYLRARGLTETAARALLLLAFARDVTDTITLAPLHDWLDAKLQERLQTPA